MSTSADNPTAGVLVQRDGESGALDGPGRASRELGPLAGSRELARADRPDGLRALSRLGFEELGAAAGGIGHAHRAIADRAFRATGPAGRVPHATHNAIARGVYAAVRGTSGALAWAADAALERRVGREARAVSATPRGSALLGVVNGLIGDVLESKRSDLQEPMGIRVDGRAVSVTPAGLAAAFPEPTPLLAGIRDLRQGSLVDEDWHGRSPTRCEPPRFARCSCSKAPRTLSSRPP